MALKGRDIILAGVAAFIAWGYAIDWWPSLRWAGRALVTGVVLSAIALLALVLLTSYGNVSKRRTRSPRPRGVAFLGARAWVEEVAALQNRQTSDKTALYAESPKISSALNELLDFILRDFVESWYSHISKNSSFPDEVDKTILALCNVRDRLLEANLVDIITTRLVPILTAHFRDFYDAERTVRGKKLNRSITESDELDLAIASKFRDGKLHPAASLSFPDTKLVQQDYLRKVTTAILPKVLPLNVLASRAVSTIIREIVACAVLFL